MSAHNLDSSKLPTRNKPSSKQIEVDTRYQELYQEMRRYRDYELTSSTWYTAFLIAMLGFIVTIMYGGENFSKLRCVFISSFLFQIIVSSAITFLGCASVYTVRYVNLQYEHIKKYVFDNENTKSYFIPDWQDFKHLQPLKIPVKPVCLIYIVHFVIMAITNAVIFSTSGPCRVLLSFVMLIVIYILIFQVFLPWRLIGKGN